MPPRPWEQVRRRAVPSLADPLLAARSGAGPRSGHARDGISRISSAYLRGNGSKAVFIMIPQDAKQSSVELSSLTSARFHIFVFRNYFPKYLRAKN